MKIAVFCSSSNQIDDSFQKLASEVGRSIASEKDELIFGGSNVGMMLRLADAVHENDGRVIGIIPQLIYDKGFYYHYCDELILTKDMHERKDKIIEMADAFLILPGGIGTLDEFFATITMQQLTYIEKPIVIFNENNYYDEILAFLDKSVKMNFSRKNLHELYRVISHIDDLMESLHRKQNSIVVDKWL